jgi:hypothetical protein
MPETIAVSIHELTGFAIALGTAILAVLVVFDLIKKAAFKRPCAFCGEKISHDDQVHHANFCALRIMLLRELLRNK